MKITALRLAPGRVYLSFNGVTGRAYRLETRPSLAEGEWSVFTNILPAETGEIEFWIQREAGEPVRFYRLVMP